jgi:alkanesulfonate monooxygenase SsuD/methylene tetrahydromethanopterin reductase-like flavin-dependent oxidoreductase (luciferase family)
VEYAVQAEKVGLDSVWVSDHYQPWRTLVDVRPYHWRL